MYSILTSVKNYKTLQSHTQKIEKWNLGNSAHRGILAAFLMLFPEIRNPDKVFILQKGNNKGSRKVLFRELEKLEEALDQLHELINIREIKHAFTTQYGPARRVIPPASMMFNPALGGSYIVHPQEVEFMNRPKQKWDTNLPFWPHIIMDVGTTEQLYFSLSLQNFESSRKKKRLGNIATHSSTWLLKLEKQLEQVRVIFPYIPEVIPSNKKLRAKGKYYWRHLRVWNGWFDRLKDLEFMAEQTMGVKTRAWVEWDYNGGSQSQVMEDYPIGVHAGLPVILLLSGILKAYLTELMARVYMLTLKKLIRSIYEELNGYTAVKLWEALSGKDALPAIPLGNPHNAFYNNRIGILKNWMDSPTHLKSFWGIYGDVQQAAWKKIEAESQKPIIEQKTFKASAKTTPNWSIASDVDFNQFHTDYLPRYPALTTEFYESVGLPERGKTPYLRFGARYFAQAHLFVAMQLLGKGLEILNLTEGFDKTEADRRKIRKYKLHRRHLKNFNIAAGSYMWGGRKTPHKTHRSGGCFDYNFGPNITPWPVSKLKNAIKSLKNSESGFRAYMQGKKKVWKKQKLENDPLVICYSSKCFSEAWKKGKNKYSILQKIIFRGKISQLIGECFQALNLDKSLINKETHVSKNELKLYAQIERDLTGSPHYNDGKISGKLGQTAPEITLPEDWQRQQAGHLAILLSAPRAIVWGAPIFHFRAIQSIRTAFGGCGTNFDLVSEIINSTHFAFLPQDHLNHWHVDYLKTIIFQNPPNQNKKLSPGWFMTPVERFAYFSPVWLALGIDMEPFLYYLHKCDTTNLFGKYKKEYDDLFTFLISYVDAYNKKYYPGGKPDNSTLEEADLLLKNLFSPFTISTSDNLLSPTIKLLVGQVSISSKISRAKNESTRFIQYFTELARKKHPKEFDQYMQLEVFGFDEYMDLFGLQETDDDED